MTGPMLHKLAVEDWASRLATDPLAEPEYFTLTTTAEAIRTLTAWLTVSGFTVEVQDYAMVRATGPHDILEIYVVGEELDYSEYLAELLHVKRLPIVFFVSQAGAFFEWLDAVMELCKHPRP